MKERIIVAAIFLLGSFAVNAGEIYYCVKNGKKIMSDQSCDKFDASEQKHVYTENMPPLNISQGLTQNQINKVRLIDEANRQQALIDEHQRIANQRQAQLQQLNDKNTCMALENRKKQILSAQRAPNNISSLNYYQEELRKTNDELYRLHCKTL